MRKFLLSLACFFLLFRSVSSATEPIYTNYDVKVVEEVPSSSYDPIDLSGPVNL